MENALKACSSIQRLLVLVSGTLLAFSLSVGDTASYQRALNDVLALGEDGAAGLSNFITSKWIVERRNDNEILPIYQASNKTLKDFAVALRKSMNELGVRIDDERVFETTIFTNGKTLARLRGWERPDLFLPLPPVERPTVRRMLHYLEKDGLEGTILVLPSYDFWLYPHIEHAARQSRIELAGMELVAVRLVSQHIGKGRIERFELRPGNETPLGHFRFSFDQGISNREPLIELDVKVPMNRTSFRIEGDEWLELKRSWYISKGLDPDAYVLAKLPYSDLRMFDSKIGNMTLSDAADWLRGRLSDEEKPVNLLMLGISAERDLVLIIGPIILSILMIGLISSMQHITTVAKTIRFKYSDFYWGVISPSRIAKVVSLVSISLVPGATCIVLPLYLEGNVTTWIPNILGALIAIVVFLNAISLPSKLPSSE